MIANPVSVNVHVGPEGNEWAAAVRDAVTSTGAFLAPPEQASAIVWLSKDGLDHILHDGIGWVQLRSAGIEGWIDRGDLDDLRIWTAARGIYAETVAEHTLALMLAGLKLVPQYARATTWDHAAKEKGRLLRGSTVVVVGAGGIGQEVIRYLQPFGAHIVAITRSGRQVEGADECLAAGELGEVWPRADIVVLAAPSTAETHHLIGAPELDALPDHAIVVNIARGSLMDTDALVDALASGSIGAAALDVTDPEPLPDGHPLWTEPRALITPHAANPAPEQLPRLCALVVDNLYRFNEGRSLRGRVDVDAGY